MRYDVLSHCILEVAVGEMLDGIKSLVLAFKICGEMDVVVSADDVEACGAIALLSLEPPAVGCCSFWPEIFGV